MQNSQNEIGKHFRTGKHSPKHAVPQPKRRGVGAYVVAFVYMGAVAILRGYSLAVLPLGVVSLVLSILAAGKEKNAFSVTALVVSIVSAVGSALFTGVLAGYVLVSNYVFTIIS